MNILIISRYPPFPGGRENFVLELVNQLGKKNKVLVLTPDVELIEADNIIIKKYPESKKDLEEVIERFKPNIINSHTFYLSEDTLSVAKKMNIPFGITLHGDQFAIGDTQRQDIVSNIAKKSDFVINVSNNGRESLLNNVKELDNNKVSVIRNAVNLQKFNKGFKSVDSIRSNLEIKSDKFVVVTPTRIASYKGVEFLVDTVNLGKKFFLEENVLFLISIPRYPFSEEELELFDSIKNKIKDLGIEDLIKFNFSSYEDMADIYSSADAFLLPSEKEQFPMSILEAMASEIPIISTNVGGIPELLTANQDSITVDFGDTLSLYNAVEFMVLNRDNILGKVALDKVRRLYNIEDVSKKYLEVYNMYI